MNPRSTNAPPKISYTIEVEHEDTTETEESLNFQEMEMYLKKTLFHLRHRALHAQEGDNQVAIRISLIAHNPNA